VTAGITGATRVYLSPGAPERAHPVYDIVTRLEQTRLLAEAAARGCVPHPGLPMLAGQVDLILDFLGLSGTGQFHDRERFLVCPD
jgi:shikimate 5-dehydrogenase